MDGPAAAPEDREIMMRPRRAPEIIEPLLFGPRGALEPVVQLVRSGSPCSFSQEAAEAERAVSLIAPGVFRQAVEPLRAGLALDPGGHAPLVMAQRPTRPKLRRCNGGERTLQLQPVHRKDRQSGRP